MHSVYATLKCTETKCWQIFWYCKTRDNQNQKMKKKKAS